MAKAGKGSNPYLPAILTLKAPHCGAFAFLG